MNNDLTRHVFVRDEEYENALRTDTARGYIISKAGLRYLLSALDDARAEGKGAHSGWMDEQIAHAQTRIALEESRAEADRLRDERNNWKLNALTAQEEVEHLRMENDERLRNARMVLRAMGQPRPRY